MTKSKLWRGLCMIFALLLGLSIIAAQVMETYRSSVDELFGTQSVKTVTDRLDNEEDTWNFKSEFTTAKAAVEGFEAFSIAEAQETFALLKNQSNALPISATAKVTLMGLRSYAPIYGNAGGSTADKAIIDDGNTITEAFKESGLQLNPSMLKAYENYCAPLTWGSTGFGPKVPAYQELSAANDIFELSIEELTASNPSFRADYAEYDDAAIVIVGRTGGENVSYYLGEEGMVDGLETTTGNIMGLSTEEKEIIAEAKANFEKVIVLINSSTTMEFDELKDDTGIDAIMWIGYPGSYGFHAVADVLTGVATPSAHLGDTFAVNNQATPAMQSFGKNLWANADSFAQGANVNSVLVQAEGIYAGYRYYETRYADIVNGVSGAATASAGTYTNANGTISTVDGTWSYENEVIYPFGYGLSYTTFSQTLDSVSVRGDKKVAYVTVTVKNTGSTYSGKSVVQLYAQTPYTQYDKDNGIEKAAIQLMDFEKTTLLAPGASQTITMEVDMSNLASYDSKTAKTYIVDPGTYYFAIGDDSHNALNNIFAKQGKTDVGGDASKVYSWEWTGDVDAATFSVSKAGVNITNALSEGDYSMDLNTFMPGTVTYFTRSNWNGTFPKSYSNLTAEGRLAELLGNDFIPIAKNEDTSDLVFGDTKSELTLNDLKGADFDDDRWDELVNKVTIDEFLTFASKAFHNIQEIPSVNYVGNQADDGPGGSDSGTMATGSYQGVAYADAADYATYGTRTAPAPINLAYSWNKELAYRNGEIILGESTLMLNLPIMIGPGMNIHRHGYNGRGAEYYSEDPILSGFIGSAVVQGAQSKGCLVNIKHAAFNDQEIDRSGVAVFMSEQKARELELRNLQQAFEANGKPASFRADEKRADTYTLGALGVMSSYNRIGATAPSANRGVMVNIMRNEWDFNGYNVTDFTGVSLKAAPKESILAGTTAFCGFGTSVDYWTAEALQGDRDICLAIKENTKYILYSLANSAALNGVNATTRRVELMTSWRAMYISLITIFSVLVAGSVACYVVFELRSKKQKEVK